MGGSGNRIRGPRYWSGYDFVELVDVARAFPPDRIEYDWWRDVRPRGWKNR